MLIATFSFYSLLPRTWFSYSGFMGHGHDHDDMRFSGWVVD